MTLTGIYHHPDCLKHNPGPDRSFAPARIEAVLNALKSSKINNIEFCEAPTATIDYLKLVHTQEYIDKVLELIPEDKEVAFDFETFAVTGTAQAALRSAGLVAEATRAVVKGEKRNAFCIASPGGHHAEADIAIGYCFFNHVALAAVMAQKHLGVNKVAVLDFDAHHGNGTQSIFWNFENRLFISLHEDNALSGFANEHGAWDNVLNIPLLSGSDGTIFRKEIEGKAFPKIESFKPDILFVSAGFDMHGSDPLSTLSLNAKDYGWLGTSIQDLANRICDGKVVAVMEGGYNLEALADSAADFVKGMAT